MNQSENKWSCDEPSDDARSAAREARQRVFRIIACGVPVGLGLVFLVWLLFKQERLAFDRETGNLVWQAAPIYLEEPGHEVSGHRYRYDAKLGWRNIPNWRASTNGRTLTINSSGLRDRDYPYEKPAAVTRVLVLGDSYTWGYGVSDDEIFTEVLEARFAQASQPWEIINTGVSGWGTDQQYLFLLDEGFRYSPDIVILSFFLINDPDDCANSPRYRLNKPVFVDRSLTIANVPVPTPFETAEKITSNSDPVLLSLAIIDAMAYQCARRNVSLIVTKFGLTLKSESADWQAKDKVFTEGIRAKESSLLFVDLDQEFANRSISRAELLEGNDDGHWNAFGHRKVAQILYEFMAGRGLLEGRAATPE